MAGVGEMRSSPPAKRTIPVRAWSISSSQPAPPSSSRPPGKTISRAFSRSARGGIAVADAALTLASGRFHGSVPGIASRVTSTVNEAPSFTPSAPFGSRYSPPSAAIATALRPPLTSFAATTLPEGTTPSSSIRASTISPSATSAARVSPMPRSTSHSDNGVARALQQHARLGQWQADDVRIAAGDVADINLAITLERIAPGLASPFAMGRIIVDFFIAKALHRDHGLDQPLTDLATRHGKRDPGQHAMASTGQQLHASAKRRLVLDFGK